MIDDQIKQLKAARKGIRAVNSGNKVFLDKLNISALSRELRASTNTTLKATL